MQTSVQALSDVEMKVEVEIAASEVDRELDRQLSEIGRKARIKGFRPGKAPRAMVKKLYGGQIASDATRNLINASFAEALDKVDRPTVGEPNIEPGIAREGEPLRYAIRIQVKPHLKIASWRGIEVSVPPAVVDAAQVDAEIEQLRGRHKERVPVEDRGADTGDILVVNTKGKVEGEADPRLDTQDMEIKIGSGQLIPGFEDQLMGARVGESRTVSLNFPDDYHADLAGKAAEFEVEVTQHVVEELPEIDDDFAQDVGFDSVEALRADITSRLETTAAGERERKLEDGLISVLLERNPFQVPSAMVQGQLEANARRLASMLTMQGLPREQAIQFVQQNVQQLHGQAERAVKRYLALEALADSEELTVTDAQVDAEIVKRIETGGERVARQFEKPEEREGLRLELRERTVLDLLQRHAKITDAPQESTTDAAETAAESATAPAAGAASGPEDSESVE